MRSLRNMLVALLLLATPGVLLADTPVLTLTTTPEDSTLSIGQTTTVTVSIVITDAEADDGVIAYDLDLFPLDKSGVHILGTALLDPAATVTSLGTIDPGTGGLLGIRGTYAAPGKGVNTPVNLFTFQLVADKAGANSISAGLSVYPGGLGTPFTLNKSGAYVDPSFGDPVTFTVNSSAAIAPITVLVPEPGTGILGIAAATWLLARRRR